MAEPGRRRVVDGAVFGVYEDDEPERGAPRVALAVLAVTALAVGVLVWRAVNTDAGLDVPAEDQLASTTSTTVPVAPPTVEELRLLLPPGIDGCAPPPDLPTDGPERAVLRCAGPGAPEAIDFSLYATVAARDDAFDFVAAVLEVPDTGGDCALGRPGRHDYVGVRRVGQLACQSVAGRTDLLWTSDSGPLLAMATGEGSYAEQYRWWSDLVDRTDASFPTGAERALLGQLPDSLLDGCDRDADLRLSSGGDVVVTCRPELSPAKEITWIGFGGADAMGRWLAGRRERLPEGVVAEHAEACTADGFGRPDPAVGIDDDPATAAAAGEPAAPEAGQADYDLGGSTGTVLCHRDPAGRAVVVWTRDTGRIGSVAVGADGVAIGDLLTWWERGGHLP